MGKHSQPRTPEHRAKLGEAGKKNKGKKKIFTEEHKKNLKESQQNHPPVSEQQKELQRKKMKEYYKTHTGYNTGKKFSNETKEKMRIKKLGIPKTAEHRANMSKSQENRPPITKATRLKLQTAQRARRVREQKEKQNII